MHEHEPVDLSALDPMREPERWRAVVDATMLRVDAVLAARSRDPIILIASWRRRLVVAAAAVVILLVPVEILLEKRETAAERIQTLVQFSTRTALGEGLPTGAELSRALAPDPLP
ncbi:MAG: hypothetical protein ACREMQ_02025 [Longimicrobiales bacterium]